MTSNIAQADQATRAGTFRIDKLIKEFPDHRTGEPFRVLDGIDMAANLGDFVCIVGPSGCGKSTLLKIVAGFEWPTSGTVHLNNRRITGPGPDHVMVFQDYALFPWMNTLENVEFGLRIQGVSRRERRRRALDALDLVKLKQVSKRPVYQLSGGMRQRVSIARALVLDPAILLMDEPFGALDAQQRRLMQEELMRIWQNTGQTILFVTHSLDEAIYLSDTVVLMSTNPGRFIHREEIELPRPRDVTSEEFNAIKRRLWTLLEREVAKSERVIDEQLAEAGGKRRRKWWPLGRR